ncbi:MAG: phosphopantetheine-binding protein, partial [Candidatus Binatia bacterium]
SRDGSRRELEESFAAPRTPVEKALAKIWAEVLNLDRVGSNDNFFELGGHSLKAMQLVSKISRKMNIDCSVKLLFAHPTVSSLAAAIDNPDRSGPYPGGARLETSRQGITEEPPPTASGWRESSYITIERRPLLSLFAAGKIRPVDAAAIGYLPDAFTGYTGLTRAEILHDWYDELPTMAAISEMFLGRIATIVLPLFACELYRRQDVLVRMLIEALEVAKRIGARMVSLTGLIPSATNYGQALGEALAGRDDLPRFTTGHATTAAAMVLAIERILREAGRDLKQERMGFLGLGSIGLTVLRLMLRCLPHPKEIILCDVYSRHDSLCDIREEITSAMGFHGLARVVESKQSVPAEFYDATFIVGATNVPEVIDIELVRPGTILVDDSAPHCFSVERTLDRFQKQEDILFTAGGVLQLPQPIRRLRYLPRFVAKKANSQYLKAVHTPSPLQIGSCVLSGLLAARFQELAPTVGPADLGSCIQYRERLGDLEIQAAELHCRDFLLPEESVRDFGQRFGWK